MRFRNHIIVLLLLAGAFLLGVVALAQNSVIIDTDICTDIDDAAAMSLCNYWVTQSNTFRVLAVIVNQTCSTSGTAAQAIDTYWGHQNIPVGQISSSYPNAVTGQTSYYTGNLSSQFRTSTASIQDATTLYRTTLAAQPNSSVTIICIGYETAIDALLNSPADGISSLTGAQLVAAKVSQVVVMGGDYSTSINTTYSPGTAESNFSHDPASASDMCSQLNTLGVPTYFVGYTLGNSVTVGSTTSSLPNDSPLRRAYYLFNSNANRAAWDMMAAHFALVGTTGGVFATNRGSNSVNASTGINTFTSNTSSGTQYYLTLGVSTTTEANNFVSYYADTPTQPVYPNGLQNRWNFSEGSGTTVHDSWGGHNGTVNGSPTWTTGHSASTGALNFSTNSSGGTAYVDIPDNYIFHEFECSDYTLTAWVYIPSGGLGSNNYGIISKSRATTPYYEIASYPSASTMNFFQNDGSTNNGASDSSFPTSTGWHFVCAVNDAANTHDKIIYVDGVNEGTASCLNGSGPGDLWIGGDQGQSEYWTGYIGEVRFYDIALTSSNVSDLYSNGTLPPPAPPYSHEITRNRNPRSR